MLHLTAIALGLIGVGLTFIGIDYFSVHYLKKIYSDPEYWTQANFERLTAEDRKHWQFRKSTYDAIMAHRFRKGGIVVMVTGIIALMISVLI